MYTRTAHINTPCVGIFVDTYEINCLYLFFFLLFFFFFFHTDVEFLYYTLDEASEKKNCSEAYETFIVI